MPDSQHQLCDHVDGHTCTPPYGDPVRRFLRAYGFRAHPADLAAVLGLPEERVVATRAGMHSLRLDHALDFLTLFRHWHQRLPLEHEWPTPRRDRYGRRYVWQQRELDYAAELRAHHALGEVAAMLTTRLQRLTGDARAVRTRPALWQALRKYDLEAAAQREGAMAPNGRPGTATDWDAPACAAVPEATAPASPFAGCRPLRQLTHAVGLPHALLTDLCEQGQVPGARLTLPQPGAPAWLKPRWLVPNALLDQANLSFAPLPFETALGYQPSLDFVSWRAQRHAPACRACQRAWGGQAAPASEVEFLERYAALPVRARRHLGNRYAHAIELRKLARVAGVPLEQIFAAVAGGMLATVGNGAHCRVLAADAVVWLDRGGPAAPGADAPGADAPVATTPRAGALVPIGAAPAHYGIGAQELDGALRAGVLLGYPRAAPREQIIAVAGDLALGERPLSRPPAGTRVVVRTSRSDAANTAGAAPGGDAAPEAGVRAAPAPRAHGPLGQPEQQGAAPGQVLRPDPAG